MRRRSHGEWRATAGTLKPAVVLFVCALGFRIAWSEPSAALRIQGGDDKLDCEVRARAFPRVSSLRVDFVYDGASTDMREALLSSPIPGTAMAAALDTAARLLEVTIVTTSPRSIGDDVVFLRLRVPLTGAPAESTHLCMERVAVLDEQGITHEARLQQPVGVRQAAPSSWLDRRPDGGAACSHAVFSLLGRRAVRGRISLPRGLYIRRVRSQGLRRIHVE